MVMKRYFIWAVLILAAVSCGGRHGRGDVDDAAADSLATVVAETPVEKPAEKKTPSKADTLSLSNYKDRLPQEPIFDIVTSMGTIRVKLYKDTPKHRDNFIRLAITRFYDNVLFHRVIDGFMIQGGDPYTRDTSRIAEWGEGGPGYTIDAEILPEHRHIRGALAAARRVSNLANPLKESSGSQFYLVQDSTNCQHLNGEFTVFGEAVAGLNVIDRIARVNTDRFDHPIHSVIIFRVRPNDLMNKRALEDEQRSPEELDALKAAETAQDSASRNKAKSVDIPEEVSEPEPEIAPDPQNEAQPQVDSFLIRARKRKQRMQGKNN